MAESWFDPHALRINMFFVALEGLVIMPFVVDWPN